MQFDMPHLHSRVVPCLRAAAVEPDYEGYFPQESLTVIADAAELATIFDCRSLPDKFVFESGDAAYDEHEALRTPFRLPYSNCYFEFPASIGVFASEITNRREDETVSHKSVELVPFIKSDTAEWGYLEATVLFENWHENEFLMFNNVSEDGKSKVTGNDLWTIARMTMGAVSLLSEKLLTSEHKPDPAPKLTRARMKRGKPRLTSDYHLLRVNVPAVRKLARPIQPGGHESPCLHWRRGHWRVFDHDNNRKTFVRKCLVGDPARGYVAKDYCLFKGALS
jgi:hypothetical protein